MKTLKKGIILLTIIISTSLPVSVFANSIEVEPILLSEGTEENSTYSTDTIEYVYRTYNGKLQYRRWNATKGYWIDATWLDVI